MANNLEITGTLHEISETEQVSEKFQKREFVVNIVNGQYTDPVQMQMVQEKTALLDGYTVGQQVTIAFNLRGRAHTKEGKTRYFSNIEAWRISAA